MAENNTGASLQSNVYNRYVQIHAFSISILYTAKL